MGLNESYDNIRNQILVLDPLLHVNKAYLMVLRVEQQRKVNLGFSDTGDGSAIQVKDYAHRANSGPKNFLRRKGGIDKRNLVCSNCNRQGHNKDTCFKLHGVPDWYKDLNDQIRKSGATTRAYAVTECGHQISQDTGNMREHSLVTELMEALRIVQNKLP
ncbi:hypothetical protein Sango_1895000 [Sesamum angolense]|uniref:Uncharacterized protein n=1 Tax=Sesamum angolense TaxID=2727404 RepID=A0AAE1WJA7_9LAMI|nr:hypothetical protein Sango_1895000 [Sesamum angolense]